jgi:hypothetical protein
MTRDYDNNNNNNNNNKEIEEVPLIWTLLLKGTSFRIPLECAAP